MRVRLRALALGIRPTLAAECGLEPRGTVDILDASGITGWRIGIRQLADDQPLVAWARAELDADVERWRYLEAFVDAFRRATSRVRQDANKDETRNFWWGWRCNMAYAFDLLVSRGLVVSPGAVDEMASLVTSLGWRAGRVGDVLGRLQDVAAAYIDPSAAEPPPLVLPEHRDVLVAALRGVAP